MNATEQTGIAPRPVVGRMSVSIAIAGIAGLPCPLTFADLRRLVEHADSLDAPDSASVVTRSAPLGARNMAIEWDPTSTIAPLASGSEDA